MPLNTLRLNHAPSSHPNDRIVFIKPLPRPPSDKTSYDTADTFLRAIAAQCLPIMKNHHLAVTTLAEHEPNQEFIGRNFNNGEIIELVLRTHSGGWVSFQMVQMVMMHELAHNLHMVCSLFSSKIGTSHYGIIFVVLAQTQAYRINAESW
jgi:hypothetical protein